MYKYEIVMYWSGEDQCYVTEVPELPGCMSDGETPVEAIQNTQEIIKVWIETAIADGDPIPEPKKRKEISLEPNKETIAAMLEAE